MTNGAENLLLLHVNVGIPHSEGQRNIYWGEVMPKKLLLLFVLFISAQAFTAETYQVPAVSFRPQFYYDTSSTVAQKTVAMPRYLGQSWTNWSLHPTPRFPVSSKMDAVVRLPDGARVTSFVCTIFDKEGTPANFTTLSGVRLKRVKTNGDSISSQAIADSRIGSRPNRGTQHIAASVDSRYAVIDNNNYAYVVAFEAQLSARPSWFDLQFRGCRIGYQE